MASEAALRSLHGEGVVEFALHPGGYVRFGDDFILVATPRSPRGPLTVIASDLHAAPLRPGDRARIDDALHVGAHTIPLVPSPWPRPKLGAAWRAALDVIPRPPAPLLRALRAGDLTRVAGVGEGLTPMGDDMLAGYAYLKGTVPFTTSLSSPSGLAYIRCASQGELPEVAARAAGYAYLKGTVPFTTSLCSPLGLAYIRCAARGELPEVVARVLEAGDEATARRRAKAVSQWGSSSGAAMLWGVASAT